MSIQLTKLRVVCMCVFRIEAPRYKGVSPANGGEPQRLVITEEVRDLYFHLEVL